MCYLSVIKSTNVMLPNEFQGCKKKLHFIHTNTSTCLGYLGRISCWEVFVFFVFCFLLLFDFWLGKSGWGLEGRRNSSFHVCGWAGASVTGRSGTGTLYCRLCNHRWGKTDDHRYVPLTSVSVGMNGVVDPWLLCFFIKGLDTWNVKSLPILFKPPFNIHFSVLLFFIFFFLRLCLFFTVLVPKFACQVG